MQVGRWSMGKIVVTKAVLALDMATTTGWAIATPTAVAAWPIGLLGAKGPIDGVTYGSVKFGGNGRGLLFLDFSRWLDRLVVSAGVGFTAVEAPVQARTMAAMRIAGGLAAVTEMICAFRGVKSADVAPTTVKKHFSGTGTAKKQQIMAVCDARGWLPQDNNAGDALAVLDWAIHSFGNIANAPTKTRKTCSRRKQK